jgi:hypothetical protein
VGVSKSLKMLGLFFYSRKMLKWLGLEAKSLIAIKKPAGWRAFCSLSILPDRGEILCQIGWGFCCLE